MVSIGGPVKLGYFKKDDIKIVVCGDIHNSRDGIDQDSILFIDYLKSIMNKDTQLILKIRHVEPYIILLILMIFLTNLIIDLFFD